MSLVFVIFRIEMKRFATAVRTLTIFPLPGKEGEQFSSSLPWFPVVGLLLGLILYGIGVFWTKALPLPWPGGGALMLLALEVFLTRALHLDGLSDWADALGGGHTKEQRLAVMKDPHIGAFGAVALVVFLLAKWVSMERLLSRDLILCLVPVMVISRGMMAELMTTLPYARAGKGMAGAFMAGASRDKRVWARIVTLCACLIFGPVGIALLAAGWALTRLMGGAFRKQFGGITGDLLGASGVILEASLLMGCAIAGDGIHNYMGWGWR